jgi:hypothetical protein
MAEHTIDLGALPPEGAIELLIWRARAINGYAELEQSLCSLFATLTGSPMDVAATIFYRITNSHSRNGILESLPERKFKTQFEAYWYGIPNTPHKRGLFTLIKQLDQTRNQVVHWHTMANITAKEDGTNDVLMTLTGPNFWMGGDTPALTAADLRQFVDKASFTSRSINMFLMIACLDVPVNAATRQTWLGIFQQPCIYPIADTHPLSPNYKEPENPSVT